MIGADIQKNGISYSMDNIIPNSMQCGFSMEKFEFMMGKYRAVEIYMEKLKQKYPNWRKDVRD